MLSSLLSKAPLVASARQAFQKSMGPCVATAPIPPINNNVGAVRCRSNRSRRGLYDGKDIRAGNNVSFSMKATRRKFKPNVFIKRVYSEILDDMIPFHLTTSALRSIDKCGGLDNYLLKNEFTEGEGYKIKKKILKRLKNRAYLERKAAVEAGKASATDADQEVQQQV